jgi:CBS-domain-containing membrane protein
MRVSELMQGDLETVMRDTPIHDLAVILADSRGSAVPVVDGEGRLVGVISKTDLMASRVVVAERRQEPPSWTRHRSETS